MSKILSIFIYALAVLMPGCGPSAKEKQTVSELTKEMQTFCVGRHLIDLPKGFELMNGAASSFMPAGIPAGEAEEIETINITPISDNALPKQFQEAVAMRRDELAAKKRSYVPNEVLLQKFEEISKNAVFFRSHKDAQGEGATRSEMHMLIGNGHIRLETISFNGKFLKSEQYLSTFSKNLEQRKLFTESQPGFCIGPVVVKGNYTREDAGFSFRSKAHPDLMFNVDINTYSPTDSSTLLQRTSGPASLLSMFHIGHTVLRKGTLSVAGMKAEEWLGWTKLGDGEDEHKEHSFTMETMRDTPSPSQPQLHLNMSTGQQDLQGRRHAASLTDKEAIGVWDAVVKSIRLRPGVL